MEGSKEAAINIVRRLGYDNLGDKQLKVIVAFISGRDVVVSLPTIVWKKLLHGCLPYRLRKSPYSTVADFFRVIEPTYTEGKKKMLCSFPQL